MAKIHLFVRVILSAGQRAFDFILNDTFCLIDTKIYNNQYANMVISNSETKSTHVF